MEGVAQVCTSPWPPVVNNALNVVQIVLLAWIAKYATRRRAEDYLQDDAPPQ